MGESLATADLVKLVRRTRLDGRTTQRIEELLKAGADPNAFVNKNESVLVRGMDSPFMCERFVEILLAHGADPNLWRRLPGRRHWGHGETPLAVAAICPWRHGLLWTKELVNAGAKINQRDSRDRTALDHVFARMLSNGRDANRHLDHPMSDLTTSGVLMIYFGHMEQLFNRAEELMQHGAEAPGMGLPATDFIDYFKTQWNRCVEWEQAFRSRAPEQDFDPVVRY